MKNYEAAYGTRIYQQLEGYEVGMKIKCEGDFQLSRILGLGVPEIWREKQAKKPTYAQCALVDRMPRYAPAG